MSPSSRYWSPQAAVNFISADNLHLNCHILYYPPITLLWRVFLQLYSLYFYILCFIFQYLEIQIIILHSFGHHFFILLGGLLAPTSSSKGPKPICQNSPLLRWFSLKPMYDKQLIHCHQKVALLKTVPVIFYGPPTDHSFRSYGQNGHG